MATYEVVGSVTGLKIGDNITDEDLQKNHPGLGGAKRLLGLGAIKPAGAASSPAGSKVETVGGATSAQNVKTVGNKPVGAA